MKDYVHTPKRVVNIKGIKEMDGIRKTGAGLRIGALVTLDELLREPARTSGVPLTGRGSARRRAVRRSGTWGRWAATSASGRAAGTSGSGHGLLAQTETARAW